MKARTDHKRKIHKGLKHILRLEPKVSNRLRGESSSPSVGSSDSSCPSQNSQSICIASLILVLPSPFSLFNSGASLTSNWFPPSLNSTQRPLTPSRPHTHCLHALHPHSLLPLPPALKPFRPPPPGSLLYSLFLASLLSPPPACPTPSTVLPLCLFLFLFLLLLQSTLPPPLYSLLSPMVSPPRQPPIALLAPIFYHYSFICLFCFPYTLPIVPTPSLYSPRPLHPPSPYIRPPNMVYLLSILSFFAPAHIPPSTPVPCRSLALPSPFPLPFCPLYSHRLHFFLPLPRLPRP